MTIIIRKKQPQPQQPQHPNHQQHNKKQQQQQQQQQPRKDRVGSLFWFVIIRIIFIVGVIFYWFFLLNQDYDYLLVAPLDTTTTTTTTATSTITTSTIMDTTIMDTDTISTTSTTSTITSTIDEEYKTSNINSRYNFVKKNKNGLIMIVGMSTLCARSSVVHQSITSLLRQDRPPDHIFVHSFCPPSKNSTDHNNNNDLSQLDTNSNINNNMTNHPLVTIGATNACPDRGPGSKLLCTLELLLPMPSLLASSQQQQLLPNQHVQIDPQRTVLILADDDHVYWKGALKQMEQQFLQFRTSTTTKEQNSTTTTTTNKDMENNNNNNNKTSQNNQILLPEDPPSPSPFKLPWNTPAVTFHSYTQNHLRIGQGADLFALPLPQITTYSTILAFYECIVHHQPRLFYHDDAWISLLLRAAFQISITTIKSKDSPFPKKLIYQKAQDHNHNNTILLGLYESKTKGLQRKDLQHLVRQEWQTLAKLCGSPGTTTASTATTAGEQDTNTGVLVSQK